jgi:hypothetical protein
MMEKFIERSWLWRRWAVFSSLVICDAILLYLTVYGVDTALSRDLAQGAYALIILIVNGYVFAGILDDRNKGKEAIAHKAVEQSDPSTTDVEIKQ